MARDDSISVLILTLAMTCRHHREVTGISRLQHIKELLIAFDRCMTETFRWDSHDVICGKAWKTTLRPSVSTMKFGPGFLQNRNPEFTIFTSCKGARSVLFHRQKVINNHWLFISIDKHAYHVNSGRINLLGHEHCLDSVFKLCQTAECSQEVAISKLALIYIIWFDTTFKDGSIWENCTCALPRERLERF